MLRERRRRRARERENIREGNYSADNLIFSSAAREVKTLQLGGSFVLWMINGAEYVPTWFRCVYTHPENKYCHTG